MKKRVYSVITLLACFMAIMLLLTGCGRDNSIVGTWRFESFTYEGNKVSLKELAHSLSEIYGEDIKEIANADSWRYQQGLAFVDMTISVSDNGNMTFKKNDELIHGTYKVIGECVEFMADETKITALLSNGKLLISDPQYINAGYIFVK